MDAVGEEVHGAARLFRSHFRSVANRVILRIGGDGG